MTIRSLIPNVVALWNAGHKHSAIAEQLGITPNYSRLLLHYAREEGLATRFNRVKLQERVDVICARCRCVFNIPASKYRDGKGKYCSVRCASPYTDDQRWMVLRMYRDRRGIRGIARDTGVSSETLRLWVRAAIARGDVPDYRRSHAHPIPVQAAGYPSAVSSRVDYPAEVAASAGAFSSGSASGLRHAQTIGGRRNYVTD